MTWTQGQPNRANQSPFIDPESEDRNKKPPAASNNYTKTNPRRNDYNPRQTQFASNAHPSNIAATFTQEGLQTFATIFSSAVEAAIAKSLPDIVERAVERKMQEIMLQIPGEINRLFSEHVTQYSLQTPIDKDDPLHHEDQTTAESGSPLIQKPRGVRKMSQEADVVIHALKDLGRPVKTDELRSLAPGIEWGSNPSVKMKNLINKSNGQIQRIGRGIYEYKTVND